MEKRELIQSEALRKSLEYHRCGLAISMGVGKTRIGIQNIQKNYNQFLNVLVVAPKVSIFKSWDDELEKLGLKDLKEHINYTTYISLNKRNPNDYDIIYLDECHNLLASHEDFLKSFKGKILGLTGTPPVNKNTEKYKMVQKFCPIVFEFTVDDATDTKILNDYQIIIHELELSKLKSYKKKNKNGGFWYSSEKSDYEYFSKLVAEAQTPKQKQFNVNIASS
jgi:superfamily II DNA or RNA helicase